MSHILVLIIGKNLNNSTAIEEKLAPFCAFEHEKQNSLYVQDLDKTKEALTEYKELLNQNIRQAASPQDLQNYIADRYGVAIVDRETLIDIEDEHKYGYAIFEDGRLIKLIERTNPNSKWDWYKIGGRWHGSIICFDGAVQNGMAFKEESNFCITENVDQYTNMVDLARFDYIDLNAMCKASFPLSPYAILDENGWQEYGKFDSYITASNELERNKWDEFIKKRIARAEADDWFVVVDCHF